MLNKLTLFLFMVHFNIFAGIVGQDRNRKLMACFTKEGKL